MIFHTLLSAAIGLLSIQSAQGLGSSCSSPLGDGTASASDPFWLESIEHQGISPIASDSSYQVFRNVKDFGAKGDGSTDDTEAIMSAMTTGKRCGDGTCHSSTETPAIVYFPSGTYVVSSPIILYYYTQVIGDAKNRPTIQASAEFKGMALLDADPYIDGGNGAQWFTNQNNFFRSVRNLVIDTTKIPSTSPGTGIHWQVSQATSLINLHFELSASDDTAHQGLFVENGSGGFMGDLTFNGGLYGMWAGNQQFTSRNLTFNNAKTAVNMQWNWGWSFQNINVNKCDLAFNVTNGGLTEDEQTSGGVNIMDATISDTPIFVQTTTDTKDSLAGSIVINNVKLTGVTDAVKVAGGRTVLEGGDTTIDSWGQGNIYTGAEAQGSFKQDKIAAPTKDQSLLDGSGKIFGKQHPQYESYAVDQFVSVRSEGAKGDGKTDDTDAIKAIFDKYAGCKIIFFDAGIYVVTSTITIPADTQIVGEAWTIIAGKGEAFSDMSKPTPIVKAGDTDSKGKLEISDIIFSTIEAAPGAIVLEWNVQESAQGNAGTWDTHVRIGGSSGTNFQFEQCPALNGTTEADKNCITAFLGMHLTKGSSGYFEGMWVWNADHDLDNEEDNQRVSLYSGRGLWSESQGPVWLIGTGSEHHALYQYFLDGAKNHFLEMIQTETPYYQPHPTAPAPFEVNANFHDPEPVDDRAWGLKVANSSNVVVWGAGLYSFFNGYAQECLDTFDCQSEILDIDSKSSIWIYGLNTVATTFSLSVDQKGVIKQSDNRNGFASTITSWSLSDS